MEQSYHLAIVLQRKKVRAVSGDLKISYIDFEVAVSASSENLNNGEKTGGVEVSGSVIGVRFGGKFGGKSVSEENKQVNENVSKIKFSIPVIYPTQPVKERNTRARAFLP